ncbi:carbohydrate binding domain-containing protein, partial [Ruminococcus sp.]|uniref:carbohydrate binding domain-containing protein n=1 Tax=Ruminococcus sp. TaxID=41978 RepID=UPI0025E916A6
TPAYTGTFTNDDDEGKYYNVYTRTTPDRNNYSGDYNNLEGVGPISGNRPVQGIVSSSLDEEGYPTIRKADGTAGNSLKYLFSTVEYEYKKIYPDVNHLLQVDPSNGHLYYNSNLNYAYYNVDTHDFTVYDRTFDIVNGNHHLGTDTDISTGETYAHAISGGDANPELGNVDPGFKIGFFPFDEYDYTKKDPNFNTGYDGTYNHHFGMMMEAKFDNPQPNDTNDIYEDPVVFKYSGDDDMWVFVDGRLVLDIGGIHEPAGGMIDFTNGLVWVQDNAYGKSLTGTADSIESQLTAKGKNFSALPKPTIIGNNTASTTVGNETKWIVTYLEDYFSGVDNWNQFSAHEIKMFYLERGGCYSNLAMDINLPTVKPLAITKSVDYNGHFSGDYDKTEYSFTVYEKINGIIEKADLGSGHSNPFKLKNGQRMDLYNFNENREFYVVETGVDPNIIAAVKVNGDDRILSDGEVKSGEAVALSEKNQYDFINVIKDERTSFDVRKVWDEVNDIEVPHDPIYFKLYQTDSSQPSVRKPVEIGGNITFALNSGNNWIQSFSDLPLKYGTHSYSYSVEEVVVPTGYEVAYSKDTNGNLFITNRAVGKSKLYVEKQWLNARSEEKKPVEITLKRKKKLISTKDATLKVNIYDPGNNLIKSSGETPVYIGGSAEFSLNVPGNVQFYSSGADGYNNNYYKLSSNNIVFESLGNNLFKVSNLQSGSNIVDIKIYNEESDDSLLLLHHSFTRVTDGWEPQGNVIVASSSNDAFAKGDALLVKERTTPSQGARLFLDPKIFKAGKTYTFSLGVFYNNRWISAEEGNESNPASASFVMTLNDGLEKDNFKSYHRVSSVNVKNATTNGGGWVKLTGTVTLPDEVNPYGMYLLIETEGDTYPKSFRIDEFVAVEGYKNVEVDAGTGVVHVSQNAYYYDEFGDNIFDGWSSNGGATIKTYDYKGDYYILITGRDNVADGIKKNVPLLEPGKKYRFRADVSGDDETSTHKLLLSINKINLDPNTAASSYSNFKNIAALPSPITGYNWGTLEAVYTIPAEADQDNMYVYFESPQGSNDHNSFRVWNFKVTDPDDFTVTKAGYDLVNGVYTSNYDLYGVTIQEGSVAMKDYEEDAEWSKQISLGNSDVWNWNSTKAKLGEDANHRYIYYVASETVSGATENEDYIMLPVENQNVASNDESTPILVKNKSIVYKLPTTGGSGTGRIYFLGGIFTIIGIISGSALYRHKRRRS